MASLTVLIFSASSSGISIPKASSKAMTSSMVSRESAPRSSTNDAAAVTSPSLTPSWSTMIDFTFSCTEAIDLSPLTNLRPGEPPLSLQKGSHCNTRLHRSKRFNAANSLDVADLGAGGDPAHEAAQDLPRSDLDEAVHARRHEELDAFDPAHGRHYLPDQRVAHGVAARQLPRVDVGHERNLQVAE